MNIKSKWGAIFENVSTTDIIDNQEKWCNVLFDKKLLIFRGLNNLSEEEHWNLLNVFGNPWIKDEYKTTTENVVEISDQKCYTQYGNLLTEKTIGNKEMPWHRDIPWHREKRYPIRSLYPIIMNGGSENTGTRFCDADSLWDKLHLWKFKDFHKVELLIQSWYQQASGIETPQVKKIPLVEQHPITKRNSVLLNSFGPVKEDLEFSTPASGTWILDALLDNNSLGLDFVNHLHRSVVTDDNIYVHKWKLGDLVLFDNWSGMFHSRDRVVGISGAERKFWRMNLKHRF